MLLRPSFVEDCNKWRNREVKSNVLRDESCRRNFKCMMHCKNGVVNVTTKVVTFTTTLDHYSVVTSESLLL